MWIFPLSLQKTKNMVLIFQSSTGALSTNQQLFLSSSDPKKQTFCLYLEMFFSKTNNFTCKKLGGAHN